MNSPELREVYNANLPKVTQYYTELGQHQGLFEKFKQLKAAPGFARLSRAQRAIVEHELRDFRLGGAELPADKKARFLAIREKLSALSSRFSDNLLDATNQTFQLRVTAFLSDGSHEDATALALYTSNDDAVAEVGKPGEVSTRGRGLTSIMVRYSGQVAAARIAVPFNEGQFSAGAFPASNFIDQHVGRELKRLHLPASELSNDSEFLRRVYLDTIGRLPSSDEARGFLQESHSSSKRQHVIDDLLQRDEFVDYWTYKWSDLLLTKASSDKGKTCDPPYPGPGGDKLRAWRVWY
jgi:hypothetical protein